MVEIDSAGPAAVAAASEAEPAAAPAVQNGLIAAVTFAVD